jgi:hypothetical protein
MLQKFTESILLGFGIGVGMFLLQVLLMLLSSVFRIVVGF